MPARTIFQRSPYRPQPVVHRKRLNPHRPRSALITLSTTAQLNIEGAPEVALAATALLNIEGTGTVALSATATINIEATTAAGAGAINEVIAQASVPIRVRAEIYAFSVVRRLGRVGSELIPFFTTTIAQQLTDETIGAQVGSGDLYGLADFEYTLELNKVGTWSFSTFARDPNLAPILYGSGKILKFYLEGVGHIYTGMISEYEINQDETMTISGYGMGILLSRHSALYRLFFGYGSVAPLFLYETAAFALRPATYALEFLPYSDAWINLEVAGLRFQNQSVEEVFNEFNSILGWNWRVLPNQMTIQIGPMGDDSGIVASPMLEDDPSAREQGVLGIRNLTYSKSNDEVVNLIVGQGSNNAFGFAVELRHTSVQRKHGQVSFYPFKDVSFPAAGEDIDEDEGIGEILAEDLGEDSVNADLRMGNWGNDIIAVAQKIDVPSEYDLAFAPFFIYRHPSRFNAADRIPRLRICPDVAGEPDTANPVASTSHANVFALFQFPGVVENDEAVNFCELIFFPDEAQGFWRLPAGTYWFVVYVSGTADWNEPAFLPDPLQSPFGGGIVFGATDDPTYLDGAPATNGLAVYKNSAWTVGGDYDGWSLLMELSGRYTTAADLVSYPYIVHGQFAAAIDDTKPTTGLRVFYIMDAASMEQYGLREAVVSFPNALDSREGIVDVEPACNTLYAAAVTYLDRHKNGFEKLQFECAGSFRLPMVGQKIRVVYKEVAEGENGPFVTLDIDALYWVLSINTRFSEEGITHSFTVANIPEDLLDPGHISNEMVRQLNRTSGFLSEIEYGLHVGIVQEPE